MVAHATISALDRFLSPLAKSLTAKSAEEIINLKIDPATQATIDDLADKANAGTISESERAEYEELVEAIDVLSILQANAREALRCQTTG